MANISNPVDFRTYLNIDTLDLLYDLMDGDTEMIIDLVDTLVDTSPTLLDDLKAGVVGKDAHKIRNAAHALKSSNAQLGAESFAKLCGEMENKGRNEDTADLDTLLEKILREFDKVEQALNSWKTSLV